MAREQLDPSSATLFLGENLDVAASLGIVVVRTDTVPRGTFLTTRDRTGTVDRIYVGTALIDPYEAVKREARAIVYGGLRRWLTADLAEERRRQLEAEDLIDQLVGGPPPWPTA